MSAMLAYIIMADIAFQSGNRSVMQYTRFLECEWAGQYLQLAYLQCAWTKRIYHGTGFDCIVIVAYLHVIVAHAVITRALH